MNITEMRVVHGGCVAIQEIIKLEIRLFANRDKVGVVSIENKMRET